MGDKKEVSSRFIKAYERLLCDGVVTSKKEFASNVGVSPSMITEISKGRSSVGTQSIQNIVLLYGVSAEWLLTGKGSMLADERPCVAATPPEEGAMLYLPLIPIDALAGFLSIDNAGVALADCPQYAVPEFSARGAEFLVRVSGESMQPRYNSGDIIACRRLHDAAFLQWGKVYVLDTSQGMLIKHIFQGRRRGSIICHSVNTTNYPDFEVPMSDIRSVSIVIGTISLE